MRFCLRSCVLFSFFIIFYSAESYDFNYLSPVPDSKLNSRKSNIIFKQGEEIDKYSLEHFTITVRGSKSGLHSGKIVLSDDYRTVVFNPNNIFDPSEEVTVSIGSGLKTVSGKEIHSYSFRFTITPLTDPISYEKIFNGNNLENNILSDTLPADYPSATLNISDNPQPGYLFLANPKKINEFGNYISILDNQAKPVKYKKTSVRGYDFKVQPNGLLSYAEVVRTQWFWGDVVMLVLDTNLNIVDSVQCGNGYIADMHEFLMMPNGHYFLLAQDPQPFDMSKVVEGGNPNAILAGSIIQELDHNKNVVFQWRSWDHLNITDTYEPLLEKQVNPFHFNAMEFDQDGNILVSIRHLCEIAKINRQTGEIMWRLGGRNNQFTFINEHDPVDDTYFSHQHNIKRIANGNITLYDNGWIRNPQWSRGVEYRLDEEAKTATLVWEYRHQPDLYTELMGSVQRLPDGSTLICWGGPNTIVQPGLTEVNPQNEVTLEMTLPKSVASYRAYKFQLPYCVPDVVAHSELIEGITYNFEKNGVNTGVKIKFNSITGIMYNSVAVEKYDCSPLNAEFEGRAPIVTANRLSITTSEIDEFEAEVRVDVSKFPEIKQPDLYSAYVRIKEGSGEFSKLTTSYDEASNELVFSTDTLGEIVFGRPDEAVLPGKSYAVSPADKQVFLKGGKPIRIAWSPKGYVTNSQLQAATDEDFDHTVLDNTQSLEVFDLVGIQQPGTYYWRVKAMNEGGAGEWSDTFEFVIADSMVRVISPNGGEVLQKDTLKHLIRWETNIGDSIRIDLFRNGSFHSVIEDTAVSATGVYSWAIPSDIPVDTAYSIKITKLGSESPSDISDNYFSLRDPETGINDPEAIDLSGLQQNYPNPVSTTTEISFSIEKQCRVALKVYDRTGREVAALLDQVMDGGNYSINFDAGSLASGDYFYSLDQDGKRVVKKMTILK